MPLISASSSQRQEDVLKHKAGIYTQGVPYQPGLHSEFPVPETSIQLVSIVTYNLMTWEAEARRLPRNWRSAWFISLWYKT